MIEQRYDILRDFPHALETKRLKIRLPLPGDGLELFNATVESLERLKEWLPWAYNFQPTLEQSEASACYFRLRFLERKELQMYLFLKDTDTLVGVSGLYNPNWSVPCFEIGYWVREGYKNQGYVTEAVASIGRFAFKYLKAKRLEIQCEPDNVASIRVPQKLGYIHEATLHHYKRHHITQELRDVLIFAKTEG